MKKNLHRLIRTTALISLTILALASFVKAQMIMPEPIAGSPFCPGSSVDVPFSIMGTFNAGNVFIAELSDALGNFSAPVIIGTISGTSSGTIAGTIPSGTSAGTGYRIRVVSSNPAVTGSDNGVDLVIQA